jgi:hypothetical protein
MRRICSLNTTIEAQRIDRQEMGKTRAARRCNDQRVATGLAVAKSIDAADQPPRTELLERPSFAQSTAQSAAQVLHI